MYKIQNNLIETKAKEGRAIYRICVLFAVLLIILASIMSVKTFVLVNIQVEGNSMYKTLYTGDMIVANRYATPKNGDVIIIAMDYQKEGRPNYKGWLVKRVIGVGGDYVKIEHGKVFKSKDGKNFDELKENYVTYTRGGGTSITCNCGYHEVDPIQYVPEGYIYFLGDNRCNSCDSRHFGLVKEEDVIGVVPQWAIDTKEVRNFIYTKLSFASCNG